MVPGWVGCGSYVIHLEFPRCLDWTVSSPFYIASPWLLPIGDKRLSSLRGFFPSLALLYLHYLRIMSNAPAGRRNDGSGRDGPAWPCLVDRPNQPRERHAGSSSNHDKHTTNRQLSTGNAKSKDDSSRGGVRHAIPVATFLVGGQRSCWVGLGWVGLFLQLTERSGAATFQLSPSPSHHSISNK
jgi:hypothetical protein